MVEYINGFSSDKGIDLKKIKKYHNSKKDQYKSLDSIIKSIKSQQSFDNRFYLL